MTIKKVIHLYRRGCLTAREALQESLLGGVFAVVSCEAQRRFKRRGLGK